MRLTLFTISWLLTVSELEISGFFSTSFRGDFSGLISFDLGSTAFADSCTTGFGASSLGSFLLFVSTSIFSASSFFSSFGGWGFSSSLGSTFSSCLDRQTPSTLSDGFSSLLSFSLLFNSDLVCSTSFATLSTSSLEEIEDFGGRPRRPFAALPFAGFSTATFLAGVGAGAGAGVPRVCERVCRRLLSIPGGVAITKEESVISDGRFRRRAAGVVVPSFFCQTTTTISVKFMKQCQRLTNSAESFAFTEVTSLVEGYQNQFWNKLDLGKQWKKRVICAIRKVRIFVSNFAHRGNRDNLDHFRKMYPLTLVQTERIEQFAFQTRFVPIKYLEK